MVTYASAALTRGEITRESWPPARSEVSRIRVTRRRKSAQVCPGSPWRRFRPTDVSYPSQPAAKRDRRELWVALLRRVSRRRVKCQRRAWRRGITGGRPEGRGMPRVARSARRRGREEAGKQRAIRLEQGREQRLH